MREMKDSGIEWIGEIPREWETSKIAGCFSEVKQKNDDGKSDNALQFKMGEIIRKPVKWERDEVAETYSNYTVVNPNVIMINGLNLEFDFITQRVAIVRENGIITSAYIAITPNDTVNPEYMCYLLKSYDTCKAFHNMGKGLRKILNYSELKTKSVLLPPLPEQHRIADFLDRKCAEIDAVIEKTKAAVEEYKKLKQSVITEAVTKGVRGPRPMKPSGIEWIGEIPREWEVIKLKYLTRVRNEVGMFNSKSDNYIGLENIESYSSKLVSTETKYADSLQSKCEKGDVLFSKLRPYLAKSVIAPFDSFCTGELLVFSDYNGDKKYLRYSLLENGFIDNINSSTYGSKMPRANSNYILNTFITFPPLPEQHRIADFLDRKCAGIDNILAKKQQFIKELEAYKKSLIYEYVTGKKEVKS